MTQRQIHKDGEEEGTGGPCKFLARIAKFLILLVYRPIGQYQF